MGCLAHPDAGEADLVGDASGGGKCGAPPIERRKVKWSVHALLCVTVRISHTGRIAGVKGDSSVCLLLVPRERGEVVRVPRLEVLLQRPANRLDA